MFLGMLAWALRKHLRDPLPDFSQSPLETMNNIFRTEPDESESESGPRVRAESYPLSGMAETDKELHKLFDIIERIYIRRKVPLYSSIVYTV